MSQRIRTTTVFLGLLMPAGAAELSASATPPRQECQWKAGERVDGDPMGIKRWRPARVIQVDAQSCTYLLQLDPLPGERPQDVQYWVGGWGVRANTLPAPRQARPARGGAPPASSTPEACTTGVGSADIRGNTREAFLKRVIVRSYENRTGLGGTSPLSTKLSFAHFKLGKPYVNVLTRKGLLHDGAPQNETIYPVATRHTKCDQFRDRVIVWVVEGRYDCFKNRFGEWICPTGLGHRFSEQR